jgi:hypothetical protein
MRPASLLEIGPPVWVGVFEPLASSISSPDGHREALLGAPDFRERERQGVACGTSLEGRTWRARGDGRDDRVQLVSKRLDRVTSPREIRSFAAPVRVDHREWSHEIAARRIRVAEQDGRPIEGQLISVRKRPTGWRDGAGN